MKRLPLILPALLLVGAASEAAESKFDARIALHRTQTTTKATTICNTYSPLAQSLPCTQFTTTAPLGYSLVYMVVGQAYEGILAVSFGIDYNGRGDATTGVVGPADGLDPDFNTFTLCADGLPFPNGADLDGDGEVEAHEEFPAPRGGTRITWVSCQNTDIGGIGPHVLIGALQVYAYAEDVMRVTPNNNLLSGAELATATCLNETVQFLPIIDPSLLDMIFGRIHFGGSTQGFTPCGVVATQATTWGKVKSLY
jgi:hypothetical protein